jgi:hypothetical protein
VKEDLLGDNGKGLLPSSYDPHRHQNVAMFDPIRVAGCLVIEVTDSGPGLSGKQLDQIFGQGVLFSVSELLAGQGSGLGLYITAGVVKLHDGSISVSSPGLGEGAIFKVVFPLVRIKHDDTAAAAAAAMKRLPSKKHFLHRAGGSGGRANRSTSLSSLGSIGSIDSSSIISYDRGGKVSLSFQGNNYPINPYPTNPYPTYRQSSTIASSSSVGPSQLMKKKLSMQSIGEDEELVDIDQDNYSSCDAVRGILSGTPRPSVTFAALEVWKDLSKTSSPPSSISMSKPARIVKGGPSDELDQQDSPHIIDSIVDKVLDDIGASGKGITTSTARCLSSIYALTLSSPFPSHCIIIIIIIISSVKMQRVLLVDDSTPNRSVSRY